MIDYYEKNSENFNLPHKISFESNQLEDQNEVTKCILRLQALGYKLISREEKSVLIL